MAVYIYLSLPNLIIYKVFSQGFKKVNSRLFYFDLFFRSLLLFVAFIWHIYINRKRLIYGPLHIDLYPPLKIWKESKQRPALP